LSESGFTGFQDNRRDVAGNVSDGDAANGVANDDVAKKDVAKKDVAGNVSTERQS
jgi:hypothetical protein